MSGDRKEIFHQTALTKDVRFRVYRKASIEFSSLVSTRWGRCELNYIQNGRFTSTKTRLSAHKKPRNYRFQVSALEFRLKSQSLWVSLLLDFAVQGLIKHSSWTKCQKHLLSSTLSREKRGRRSWGNGIQNVMFIIRYCSKRRQPSEKKMFTFRFKPGACASFSFASSATRTTRCSFCYVANDKSFVSQKRRENGKIPLHLLQFQTRADRWVLITALCVVEWNAQHNWLVCITVGGAPPELLTIAARPANFTVSDSSWRLWKLLVAATIENSHHCSSAIRPDNHVCQLLSLWCFQKILF